MKNGQSRETFNIGYPRRGQKKPKTLHTMRMQKQMTYIWHEPSHKQLDVADVSRLFYCRKLSLPGDEWRSNQLWYVQIILSFHDIFTFWILLRFPRKYDIGFDLPSSCLWEGSCHIYVICVCLRIVVSNAYCAMFLGFTSATFQIQYRQSLIEIFVSHPRHTHEYKVIC
jgi:hypothetical protein